VVGGGAVTPEDRAAVQAANEELYAAVETGDLDRLQRLCEPERELVCVHPGAAPIHGTAPVLRSWALIMANTDYIQFFLTDVQVTGEDDVAVVTCTENVLTAGPDQTGSFRGGKAVALNVFTRRPEGWRLWIHQAAPVGSDT
jgi:ketosteroid isomerase-like protein